jgi:nitroreductase
MNTLDTLKKRRSCRIFSAKGIAGDVIVELIDCARLAPSARNVQPWEFVAVTKRETLQKLGSMAENCRFLADCPCCIAVFCQDTKYYLEDGCAATVNILLAATDLGLATCWLAGDKKEYCADVMKLLVAPRDMKLVSLIAIGYSDKIPETGPVKRCVKEMLHWEKF